MRLKKHGAFLVNYVISFANGEIDRQAFDMDYSGYIIEHFPAFQAEHPRLSAKFACTIDEAYENFSRMEDEVFRDAISDAVDDFLDARPVADID